MVKPGMFCHVPRLLAGEIVEAAGTNGRNPASMRVGAVSAREDKTGT